MSLPYTPALITKLLRAMPADRLATIQPEDFQMWPARSIARADVIAEMIANERMRRT